MADIGKADQSVLVVNSSIADAIPVSVVSQTETPTTVADGTDVTVTSTAGGVTLLAANASRKGGLIQNTGSVTMRVTLDGSAPTATHGIQVVAGAGVELDSPYCPTNTVKAIGVGGSTTAFAEEVT